uniref:Protein kinase domain-containing protein n=1 Tax=Amphora coffeiformis TaxID=265554 RepID=A0A7S3L401_9STRA
MTEMNATIPQQQHEVVDADFQWPTDATGYELVSKIGQGAFATVFLAKTVQSQATTTTTTTTTCAVKILNLDHVDSDLAEIRREVQAMRLSSHPNVLTCLTAFCYDVHLWLVTPLMRKGSSLHCLQTVRRVLKQSGQPVPPLEAHILYIVREALLGLQYIHQNGQIHRDVKGGNLLLDANGDVKVADFGVSGWLVQAGQQQEKAKTFVGTPCWMAPEGTYVVSTQAFPWRTGMVLPCWLEPAIILFEEILDTANKGKRE